ncbi:MAG: serine/threonine-protein kinase [Acidimicrobiales bacterium]
MRHSEESPQPDQVIVDGFEHLEPIGRGGFSRVFRADQVALGRSVAIKLLDGDLDSAAKQKSFERECRAMGTLSQHPNIVTVFSAAYTTTGRPCIVMEYYEAGTLGDEVKKNGPLSLGEVVRLGIKLCDALTAAHTAGIVHRDIKPQNVFRSTYADVVLGDFGISSFAGDHTATRADSGLTIHYAPPELIEGATHRPGQMSTPSPQRCTTSSADNGHSPVPTVSQWPPSPAGFWGRHRPCSIVTGLEPSSDDY